MKGDGIVITGAGVVIASGLDRASAWRAIRAGESEIRPLTVLEGAGEPARTGGQAPDPPDLVDAPDAKTARETVMLRRALREALCEAGLDHAKAFADARCAVVLGTTLAGMRAGGRFLRGGDPRELEHVLAGAVVRSLLDDLPAFDFATTTCAACASGLAAVGLGRTLLETGEADLVVAVGYDPISEYAYAGFASLRVVAPGPPRPFARDREGMNLGEGYGVLVLEREARARRRGARPIARVGGFGEASDAHHLTRPHPDGRGAVQATQRAIEEAGWSPEEVDLVVAHATGTPENDAAERRALRNVFGDRLPNVPVVAFKSHFGHTLGGAGTAEIVLALEAMREGVVPPTANVTPGEREFDDVRLVTGHGLPARIDRILALSIGFGGANAAIAISRAASTPHARRPLRRPSRDVWITGVGVVTPDGVGHEALVDAVAAPTGTGGVTIDADALDGLIDARRARRLADGVKYLLAATTLAVRDAGIEDASATFADGGVILASAHGTTSYTERYYREVVEDGLDAANPMLFAEGVPNVGSAHLSMSLGLTGPAQTLIGTRTAGLDALALATERIRSGEWSAAFVGAAEERSELVDEAYAACGWPVRSAAAATVFVLESDESARGRRARPRGRVRQLAARQGRPGRARSVIDAVARVASDLGAVEAWLPGAGGSCFGRIEHAGLRRAGRARSRRFEEANRPETFAAAPLLALARPLVAKPSPSSAGATPKAWGVVAIDPSGAVRGAAIVTSPDPAPALLTLADDSATVPELS